MPTPIENNTSALQNLLSKVNELPSVQKTSGTVTSGEWGLISIELGFFPDYVVFTQGKTGSFEGVSYPVVATATFETSDAFSTTLWSEEDLGVSNNLLYEIFGGRVGTGISGAIWAMQADYSFSPAEGITVEYTAVKYT